MQDKASPGFSVIVPTFNRVELLKHALASIFAQRFANFEIIVVDDGSTDGTADYLISLGNRIKFVAQPNGGPGAARNFGVQHARGTYLAFLDSDDLWFPWTLEIYATILRETGNPAFMAGKPHQFRAETAVSGVSEDAARWAQFADYLDSGDQWRWWGASSFVIERVKFLEVGGFSVECGEDAHLALRLGTARGFVQVMAPVTFAYREHTGNMSSDLSLLVEAAEHAIHAESAGEYPGGPQRKRQRWRILAGQVRWVALECLRGRRRRDAWAIYRSTFHWQISARAWRFLATFPILAFLGVGDIREAFKPLGRFAQRRLWLH